ncbi:integrase catalytic domain-containing protein [Trichonephila clavipes]|nr:integrase catalytic domain-containing protein [Trichonephila clavipes]
MEEWMNFYQKLSKVNNFKIPRCILLPATIRIEIHGFSDASERAYAGVVYIKCFNESGQSQTRLLCSKSRVAPLKTLTIPRLELSAALLLSRLVEKVVPILQLPIHKIWMWTDSTIALAWIKTEPHKFKTFVSNRVAEIQALSKDYHWKHVSSKDNPADLISRGCNVDELLKNEMWFSGPDLQTDKYEDNQLFPDPSYRDELKCAVTLSMTEFINNIKAKESCNKKYLTVDEIKRSTEFLAKIAQLSEFKAEIDALKKGKGVSKTSKLRALDPFLDENSLLRVGGRLSNADLPFEAKHQIIIPRCLVLLKENDLPPCKWAMARILEVIYGTDGKAANLEPVHSSPSSNHKAAFQPFQNGLFHHSDFVSKCLIATPSLHVPTTNHVVSFPPRTATPSGIINNYNMGWRLALRAICSATDSDQLIIKK